MKQRIIATILLLVTVLTMLASCVNYAFAEESMEDYVTLDLDKLMEALHTIEIEEEDFGPSEKRDEIVVEEIYNTILTALNKDTDNEKTDGTIGTNDMVKYYYYCSVEIDGVKYTFNYNMKNAVNTLTTSTSTDEDKDIQKAIVAKIAADYTFNGETSYKVKTSLSNEKIVNTDTIVVSYTLKTTDGSKTTYTDYANKEIGAGHDIYEDIIKNEDAVVSINNSSYKANEGVKVGNNHYLNIKISHIIEDGGTFVDVVRENKKELTQVVYNADMAQETVVIPESTEITYHVYPVSYVQAPTVEAREVIKYVLGDDITTDSLTVLGSTEHTIEIDGETKTVKALVESLMAEYAKTAKDYESIEEITAAKDALTAERDLAQKQAIRDKIDALKKVEKYEDLEAAILAHTGKADIYAVFESKVKLSSLLPLGILGLYTYKNTSGATAVTLVNAINAEHDKDVNTAYDSYTKTKATIALPDDHGEKIDVADKRERYDDLVAKVQNAAVEVIIKNILKVDGVEALIVEQYNASAYKTDFLAYDLIKHILLSTSATANNFSFIEDLSDYVYGNTTLDDEERETFSTVLAALTAEFAKADTDFDTVSSVKDFKDEVEKATKAYDEAQGKTETSTTATKSISRYATLLKTYKIDANKDNKADEKVDTNADGKVDDKDDAVKTAFDALVEKYIELHPETVYVVGTANDGEKSITNSTYATEALQLIIDDVDHVADYRAVLEKDSYLNSSNNGGALVEFNNAIDLDAKSDAVKEKTEDLEKARKAAKEAAVDNLIAKLLSGVLGEEKLSVVLPVRYVENYTNGKINTYNTNVKNKLAKAVYEIINNQVVVNTDGEGYPWALVEEFEKTLKESYKSAFYTGTSDKTAAGTYGPAVSAEDIANYEKFTAQYKEANEAIASANAGVESTTTAYISALLTIYEVEAALNTEAGLSYFNENNALTTLAKAYNDAKKAYDDANAANDEAKSELKKAQTALAEAESAFETVKDEGFTIFHKEWWNARAEVKAAEKTVKEKTEKVDGTKKTDGTADVLDAATKALNKAKENLVAGFATEGSKDEFVATQKEFNTKKSAYNTAVNASSTTASLKIKLDKLEKANADFEAAKTAVDNAGEAVTEEQTKALEKATEILDGAKKEVEPALKAAKEYADYALAYYADSKAVEAAAKPDYDAAVAALEDTKDEDGNVTKEGLKTKIAKAEEFEKGEALTNVEVYGHLDAYLEHVLGYNWEAVIREQAVEQVNEQIKIYAVAKALKDVAANGYENADLGIKVDSYKAAIEAIEAEDGRITKVLEHSIKHNDEDIKDKKLQKETKEAYEKLIEATGNVFVDKKVFNEYKKELGRSNYKYAKDQYGENNLRMYLQIENLLTYLLYTDIQENEYAMHEGEYTVRELENGKLAYLFINYEFKAED